MPTEKPKKLNLKKLSTNAEPFNTAGLTREACQKCGLHRKAKSLFVSPFVPDGWTGKLVVVNDRTSFKKGVGKFFAKLLDKAKYRPNDVVVMPVLRCMPKDMEGVNMTHLRCCRPYLLQALKKLAPKHVIALGSLALKAVRNTGDGNVTKARGKELGL